MSIFHLNEYKQQKFVRRSSSFPDRVKIPLKRRKTPEFTFEELAKRKSFRKYDPQQDSAVARLKDRLEK